jgi:hypothetical protein
VLPDAIPLLRVPIVVHHLVWHRVTYPPWDAIRQCTGCVNDDDFLGATAETVLFDGAVAERDFVYLEDLENPQYSWRLTYVFREKAQKYPGGDGTDEIFGWNDAFNSVPNGAAGFDRLVDAAGNPMYATNDFSALFAFDPGAAP